jgi:flagellar protein FliS
MHLAKEYQKNSVMTADGVGIVILLYEGVVNFNNMTRAAIEANDVEKRTVFVNKSMAIVGELNDALDMDIGGVVGKNLRRLYTYMIEELMRANTNNDPAPLDIVNTLISELKEGWVGIKDLKNSKVEEKVEAGSLSVTL